MKRNLLLFTFMALCSSFIFSMPSDTRRQIKMKVRQPIEHRSTNHLDPARVYVSNSLLEIEFENPSKDVTITIINSETGQTIYQEKSTSLEKYRLIDLFGEDKSAEYTLRDIIVFVVRNRSIYNRLKYTMRLIPYYISAMLMVLFYASCNSHQSSKGTEKDIIAEFDGEAIYASEINTIIKQELYDELCRIHNIKKEALEQLINVKLLQKEANKKQLTYQQYIDEYTDAKIKKTGTDSLLKRYNINSITEFRGKSAYSVPIGSPTGKVTRLFHLKGAIVNELLDSLKRNKKILQYLYPPKSPSIDLNSLHTYYRGNLQSKVSMIIISDFDCDACINAHSLYDSIHQEYKDKVKFGYIHYSTMPTFAQIASDAANKQNKFWEFHDSLYTHKGYIDSIAAFNIAQNMSMDINKFQNDITNNEGKKSIEKTINQLVLLGIYATPTIIINGRLIVNSNSKEEICHLIDEELLK